MSRRQSQLFDSIHLHVAAIVASAGIRRASDKSLVWDLTLEAMNHASLCHNDDFLGFTITTETDHLFGACRPRLHYREQFQCTLDGRRRGRRETLTSDVRWLVE